ncbi:hypothetical protein MalM25_11980 [Planctomycetes bacterium MalM25]|nr:hypothetical protein MalM25_11980 [Planctomycetes bacterium MalM25]
MTRRRFAFWIGMGLFGAAEKLRAESLDTLAASLMELTEESGAEEILVETTTAPVEMPVHWQATHNRTWRWVVREHYVDGEWTTTGMTTPIKKSTGEPLEGTNGYLSDDDVPEGFREPESLTTEDDFGTFSESTSHGVLADEDAPGPDAASHRQARHGRPPSRWLRSLNAAELSVWLATIDPPEAGVDGMTFLEHLTRDHGFDPERVEGLSETDQEKLHGAAHHGY